MKIQYRIVQKVKKSSGKYKEPRLQATTNSYLELAPVLYVKVGEFSTNFQVSIISEATGLLSLEYYYGMLAKHIDLVRRRVLKRETIAHSEKVFSLFELHTKWINKGKAGVVAELGQEHLIVTDQDHFIVYHQLIGNTPDAGLIPFRIQFFF